MYFDIKGGKAPYVTIKLDKGEYFFSAYSDYGWITEGIEIEQPKLKKLGGFLKKKTTATPVSLVKYLAAQNESEVTFTPPLVGRILDFELRNNEFVVRKDFLIMVDSGMEVTSLYQKKISTNCFGNTNFDLVRISGSGHILIALGGSVETKDLTNGEKLVTYPEHLVALDSSIDFKIKISDNGHKLYLTELIGPGRVWLQTAPTNNLVAEILKHLPRK